ncbi:hypothetical protein PGT21_036380 [Puccinia graminis f. sp. tritici]|uniref:Uncharacterized protein n=1 Tax=Puccinia graminis f. sp. tritici TaxID=56615 RepID=A0A5B0PM01_PUCGR|nr:hypothetical protein PGT21_036380 [Puccinia graminis f. sp. tritici]
MPSVALSQEVQPERLAVALQKKYCILFFALLAIVLPKSSLSSTIDCFQFKPTQPNPPRRPAKGSRYTNNIPGLVDLHQPFPPPTPCSSSSSLRRDNISIRPKPNRCPVISRSAVTQSKKPPDQSVPSQWSWLIV